MAEAACKPAGPGGHQAAPLAATETAAADHPPAVPSAKIQDPSPTPRSGRSADRSPSWGRVLPFARVFVGLVTGVLLGAYFAANLLETEYRNIVGDLQSKHRAALLHARKDYTTCQSHLTLQRTEHDEESTRLLLRADANERAFQHTAERHAREAAEAYRAASEGLDAAAARLADARALLTAEEAAHAATRRELAAANQSARAARTAATAATDAAAATHRDLEREMDALSEEFERRDDERAACDGHHRDLRDCTADLAQAREDADDRDAWEEKARSLMERIAFRHRQEVLDRYGPGPHRVKLTVETPGAAVEEILLELAPLERMPHTIHTILGLASKGLLTGCTFFLARDHILVAGPVDAANAARHDALRRRLFKEGYLPDGALLFKEAPGDACNHARGTLGFNQIGGPDFYVNLGDNTELHGPRRLAGGSTKEGDPCFGRVVAGADAVDRIVARRDAADTVAGVRIVGVEVVDAAS